MNYLDLFCLSENLIEGNEHLGKKNCAIIQVGSEILHPKYMAQEKYK